MCEELKKWEKFLTVTRGEEHEISINKNRSPFAADIDRIIFCDSFRRLSKKSQVHPLAMNDHLHTRLSHSLEVSSVGRSLGCAIGFYLEEKNHLPPNIRPEHIGEIVQAACLAHDIGNPPFGHAGEEAIKGWFSDIKNIKYIEMLPSNRKSDFTCFDGNAQGFRVVTKTESINDDEGMKLTYPVIASMVKYPISSYRADVDPKNSPRKYNYHFSETDIFKKIFDTLGLSISSKKHIRHPLSFLMESADDICYSIMDLEDALELRLISFKTFCDVYSDIDGIEQIIKKSQSGTRYTAAYIRAKVIGFLIEKVIKTFKKQYDNIINGTCQGSLVDNDAELSKYIGNAKNITKKLVYSEARKTALEIGAYTIYQSLLDTFIPAVHYDITKRSIDYSPYKYERALEMLSKKSKNHLLYSEQGKNEKNADFEHRKLYDSYMKVIDYITGMTDSYATFVSQQFLGAGIGPWQF